MAEFFGLIQFAATKPKPKEQQGFALIASEIADIAGRKPQLLIDAGVALGGLAYHAQEQMLLQISECGQFIVLWASTHPDVDMTATLQVLVKCAKRADWEGLQSLQSPFAGCVIDKYNNTCWLLSDRYRLLPLYYVQTASLLIFSSKINPLLRSGLFDWQLDRAALLDFFTFEHLTGAKTFAAEVKLLGAGESIRFDGQNKYQISSYYDIQQSLVTNRELRCADIAERLHMALQKSVQRAVTNSKTVAITLSGGLDSRALLGCALQTDSEIKTYTFGTPDCDDITIASQLAQRCGVSHRVVHIDGSHLPLWLDKAVQINGGMLGAIHLHIAALAQQIAAEADVVLDGLGGDALTGGHLSWGMLGTRSTDRAAALVYKKRATVYVEADQRRRLFEPDFLAGIDYDPYSSVTQHFLQTDRLPWQGCHRFDLVERQQRMILFGPQLLHASIAVQTPFYTPELIELMLSAPVPTLIEQRAYIRMHSEYLPLLASVADDKRAIPLSWPQSVRFAKRVLDFSRRRLPQPLRRKLQSTAPPPTHYGYWFRHNLRTFVVERLLDGSDIFEGLLQRATVHKIVSQHMANQHDNSVQIGCLLSLASWLRSLKKSD